MQSWPARAAALPAASTMPSWRSARSSSAATSRSTTSGALRPSRSSARPFGPYRGFAYACVAIAPTSGSAHGTTEPTDRNFDCTATPHCFASRSHAAIEYVATTGLRAIRQLREVEGEKVFAARGYEDGSDLGPRKRGADVLRRRRADDDRGARFECGVKLRRVVRRADDERLLDRHGGIAFDRKLRHLPAARSPPAFSHTVTVSPGSIISTVTSGASSCSFAGRPTSGGNVPQWHGTQRFTPSSSSARAASSGPIV